ncbi:beta-1,3-galactosyltransferase 6 [Dendroctonus ponderosae]
MRKLLEIKHYRCLLLALICFCLGCFLSLSLVSMEKPCVLETEDHEFNIMQNSKLKNPELIILVLSAYKNLERRNAARHSWMQVGRKAVTGNSYNFKPYFVIGSLGLTNDDILHLSSEQSRFADILILPIHDRYEKLAEKVLRMFQWLSEQLKYGLDFKYALKCDDDTFVNVPALLSAVQQMEKTLETSSFQTPPEKFNSFITTNVQCNDQSSGLHLANMSWYWGYFNGNAHVKAGGKWKESEWIACDKYVPYALGGGYILSKPLVSYIANNAANLRLFKAEDVSVGLWLAPITNIIRIHDVRMDSEWTTRGCKDHYLLTHKITPSDMRLMAGNFRATSKLCTKQSEVRRHYFYDWSIPPSRCCKPV